MNRLKREIRAVQALGVLRLSGHVLSGCLLDLGCGRGWLTGKFAESGVFAVGVDKSLQLTRLAKNSVDGCEFLASEGTYLPFRNSVFKTVIINDVLEHLPYSDAIKLMAEAIRTMSKNGKIYVSVMNRWQIIEPHFLVPFMTWLPKQTWNIVHRLKTKNPSAKYTQCYFPYTKARLKLLMHQLHLENEDYTWFYASEKIRHPEQIGNPILRVLVKLFRVLKSNRRLMILAIERVSPLIFVCNAHNQ